MSVLITPTSSILSCNFNKYYPNDCRDTQVIFFLLGPYAINIYTGCKVNPGLSNI